MNAKGVRRALERRGRFETGWTDLSRLGKLGDWMSLLGARSLQARLSREDPAKRNVFFDPDRCRPSSSGSTALISYLPAAALRVDAEGRR
jgi:hypothetical protein